MSRTSIALMAHRRWRELLPAMAHRLAAIHGAGVVVAAVDADQEVVAVLQGPVAADAAKPIGATRRA